jgi:hypothetical protein
MRSGSRTAAVLGFVASLAAFCSFSLDARADEPAPAPAKEIAVDSTKPFTIIEKLQSAQDQQILSLPLYGAEQATWTPLCITPCKVKLDLAGVYRVAPFNNVTASAPFILYPEATAVHVHPGSERLRRVGNLLLIIGASVLVGGGSGALAADETGTRNACLIAGGAGLVSMLAAIPFVVASRTAVQFQ